MSHQQTHRNEVGVGKNFGSLQSLDWTGGLDWWTGLKIIFMLSNAPVGLHLET